MSIKNILVPVDFSPPSRLAVNHAISLARIFRAKLTLMHVVEAPSGFARPVTAETAVIARDHGAQAVRMMSALVGSEDQDDLDLQIVTRSGNIRAQILSVIDEQSADVVVMGTHGRGLFGRWFIGSITEGLLRNTSIPILTVCRATKPVSLTRILFATDLWESSTETFDYVLELARASQSELTILHVLDKQNLTYGDTEMFVYTGEPNLEEAKAKLSQFVARAAEKEVKAEAIAVEGVAAEEVLKAADRSEADLIVVTVQKKGFVERVLLGTTAEFVIREANVPVLSIPAAVASGKEDRAPTASVRPLKGE